MNAVERSDITYNEWELVDTAARILGVSGFRSSIRMLCVEAFQVFQVLLLQQLVTLLVLLLSIGADTPPLPAQDHGSLLDTELGVFGPELG